MKNAIEAVSLILFGSLFFADVAAAQSAVEVPVKATAECRLPTGWDAVDQRKPDFVIFGELHGTRESPAFVGEVACALAASGKRILLGIEFDSSVDDQLQRAWKLPPAQFPHALRKAGWAGRQDGVASEAMFDLMVRLHGLKMAGAAIGVVAFNGSKDSEQAKRFAALPGQGPHEAAQAENIRIAARSARYDVALVLVGGLHAMKQPVSRSGVTFEPMAMQLAPAGSIVSLDMRYADGTAWNCQLKAGYVPIPGKPIGNDAIDCANHRVIGDAGAEHAQFVALRGASGGKFTDGYDGFFSVGPVSGSPPAVTAP